MNQGITVSYELSYSRDKNTAMEFESISQTSLWVGTMVIVTVPEDPALLKLKRIVVEFTAMKSTVPEEVVTEDTWSRSVPIM